MPQESLDAFQPYLRKDDLKSRLCYYAELIKNFIAKISIGISLVILWVIGFGSGQATICRIIYMAFFLTSTLTIQLSYAAWRKTMYGFWVVVFIYSLLHFVLISAYQIGEVSLLLESYAGIPIEWHHYIGLEVLDTYGLFREISGVTVLMIVILQQLHFHKEFLVISDISSRNMKSEAPYMDEGGFSGSFMKELKLKMQSIKKNESQKDVTREPIYFYLKSLKKISHATFLILMPSFQTFLKKTEKLLWKFLELHMAKIILVSIVQLAACDVCFIHTAFIAFAIVALISGNTMQITIIHICSALSSLLLISRMIYQIGYFKHEQWETDCSGLFPTYSEIKSFGKANYTFNNAAWIGFQKSSHLQDVFGYMGIVLVCTCYAVVRIRQKMHHLGMHSPLGTLSNPLVYSSSYFPYLEKEILFSGVFRENADDGIIPCVKFFFNYGFYKFGVEICLITTAIVIGVHMDVYSIFYSIWLCLLVCLSCRIRRGSKDKRDTKWRGGRNAVAKVWVYFHFTTAILLFLQYLLGVGLPPKMCTGFPWYQNEQMKRLFEWLPLADRANFISMCHLVYDFILLLLIFNQKKVFQMERVPDYKYPGGCNRDILFDHLEKNPVQDFTSCVSSWLDVVKRLIFFSSFWTSLVFVFLAGINDVNVFSLGYLSGCFIFLWQGNDFFLRPIIIIFKWWNKLIAYNVLVILSRSLIQLLGCVFSPDIPTLSHGIIQLLGMTCSKRIRYKTSGCDIPQTCSNFAYDAACLAFLLLQRRIFGSHYFLHVIQETKVQALLASRGAELIEELSNQQMTEQEDLEHQRLLKIKQKMEIIKESYRLKQGSFFRERANHYDTMLSGDYYMFEDVDEKMDEEIFQEISESSRSKQDILNNKSDDSYSKSHERLTQSQSFMAIKRSNSKIVHDFTSSERKETRVSERSSILSSTSSKDHLPQKGLIGRATSGLDNEQSDGDTIGITDDEGAEKIEEDIKFIWTLSESLMITITIWLNQFSKNFRYVSSSLAAEKALLKKKAWKYQRSIDEGTVMSEVLSPLSIETWSVDQRENSYMSEKYTSTAVKLSLDHTFMTLKQGKIYYAAEKSPSLISPESVDVKDKKQNLRAEEEKTSFKGDRSPAVCLLLSLWYACISHSDLICYLAVIVHQSKCASLLSIPLPFMVFLWGTLSVPRPSMTFWVTIIAYTEIMIFVKCLFDFDFLLWTQEGTSGNFPQLIVGIEKSRKNGIYDLIILLSVFFHRFMLKFLGLWENKPSENSSQKRAENSLIRNISSSNSNLDIYSLSITKSSNKEFSNSMNEEQYYPRMESQVYLIVTHTDMHEKLKNFHQVLSLVSRKYFSSTKAFFHDLLESTIRTVADVYAYMFICDFLNFIVIIFGFPSFGSLYADGGVLTYIEENRIPVLFLGMLIVQSTLMIIDRALYLKKSTLGKLIFQISLVIIVHIWMFIMLPVLTKRQFNSTWPPPMFYIVKCIYLLFSAYQIRNVYPSHILGNFLSKRYNYVNMFLFIGFMNLPFLFELRAFMDWMLTDTTMTVFEWLTLEDIFANMYLIKCSRTIDKDFPQPRGEKKALLSKYFVGGGALLGIFAIIWFPLVFFSLENAVGEAIQPHGITLELKLGTYQPIFSLSAQNNQLHRFSESNWNAFKSMYSKNQEVQSFLSLYHSEDITVVKISGYSSDAWTISPPAKDNLIQEILSDRPIYSTFTWTITRKIVAEDLSRVSTYSRSVTIDAYLSSSDNSELVRNPIRSLLASALTGSGTSAPITIPSLLPKFVKVTKDGTAKSLPQLMIFDSERFGESWGDQAEDRYSESHGFRNLSLTFYSGSMFSWWEVNEVCSDTDSPFLYSLPHHDSLDHQTGNCHHITIYLFNDKEFSAFLKFISRSGIIGLYITMVFVASKLIHHFCTGMSVTIMYKQLPNVDRILQLCYDIYLVRENGEWRLEEDLYAKLLFLYRCPELLIKWSQPIVEATNAPFIETTNLPRTDHLDEECEESEEQSMERRS